MRKTVSQKRQNYLTQDQKRRVLEEIARRDREGSSWRLDDIAEWARDSLQLQFTPSRSTISRVRSNKNAILCLGGTGDRKKIPHLKSEAVESAICAWINEQFARQACLSGELVKEKGRMLLEQVNDKLPDDQKIVLKFSNGWLQSFQERNGFKSFKCRSESSDADINATQQDLSRIKQQLSKYAMCDIWNADEFGLFYEMAPSRTIASTYLPGRKKEKARLTYLACANADGKEKFPLCVIGNARKPRSFKEKTGQDLGFDYHHNRKAWMTSALFFGWLKRFDKYIGETDGRKVALLIDVCSAHGTAGSLPNLENVEVILLPPNTTSKVQPMDAGVSAVMKMRYRRRQLGRVLELIEANEVGIYKVDQLTAMRWMKEVWDNLDATIIFNCWMHTKLVNEIVGDQTLPENDVVSRELTKNRAQLSALLKEVVESPHLRISVDDLLNPTCEDECTVEVSDEYLVRSILAATNNAPSDELVELDDDEGISSPLPILEEQLRCLSVVSRIFDARGMATPAIRRGLEGMQNSIRAEKKSRLSRTA